MLISVLKAMRAYNDTQNRRLVALNAIVSFVYSFQKFVTNPSRHRIAKSFAQVNPDSFLRGRCQAQSHIPERTVRLPGVATALRLAALGEALTKGYANRFCCHVFHFSFSGLCSCHH
jgi:hypothetical protein